MQVRMLADEEKIDYNAAKVGLTFSFFVCLGCVFEFFIHVSVAVAVPLASWGTTAATRIPRLRIGERPREWTRG